MKNKLNALFLISLFSLTACEPTSATIKLKAFNENPDIHTSIQNTYFINKTFEDVTNNTLYGQELTKDIAKKTDLSAPEPILIKWSTQTDKGKLSSYQVYISENEDLSDPYIINTTGTTAKFYNAKIATTYYYKVTSGKFESEVGSFTTIDKGPRNIYVDGVRNVRDLGGYGYIKQGMIYRGGAFEEMNKDLSISKNITKKGIKTIQEQLKIKTEIDLRKNLAESNVIENCALVESTVEGLNYFALPMIFGNHDILSYSNEQYDDPARVKDFFELLADETNYPVYFHCSYGKDRTGGLAYTLEALLGADKESLYRDYLFSNFASFMDYNLKITGIEGNFGKTLNEYPKDADESITLAERTYRYLNEKLNISTDTLDAVINILGV